ncbi:unnamed protein product [Camellia sinensis]
MCTIASPREGFYASALRIHQNHPKTVACNVTSFAEFGYFKDLLEILYRLLEGPDVRKHEKAKIEERKATKGSTWYLGRIKRTSEKDRIDAAKKGVERYYNDPIYQFLNNQVAQVFADALKADLDNVNASNLKNISFAAKWCPSLYSFFDRSTLLCESIAKRLFPRDSHPEYEAIDEAHYAYRVRDRLRKEVLVPLHIAAGALLPHEIIASLDSGESGQVAELQWQRIVNDLSTIGKLKNCLAICDVSGSMYGVPLEVSVALELLVSELSEEPWKGKLNTFSHDPQLHVIEGDTLLSKVRSIERMNWLMNTDFLKVFDKILEVANKGKLSEKQMIKRLFVFSDMEFDQASANPWETDYKAICRKFDESGYKSVPKIVFWNLQNLDATPVPSCQKGVALVSEFSKNLLKMFLEEGGVLSPESTMELAIAGEEYSKLVVID